MGGGCLAHRVVGIDSLVLTTCCGAPQQLLRVIDELDAENRTLLAQLVEVRDHAALAADQSAELAEARADTEVLQARVQDLTARNRGLVDQFSHLHQFMAAAATAAPPRAAQQVDRRFGRREVRVFGPRLCGGGGGA